MIINFCCITSKRFILFNFNKKSSKQLLYASFGQDVTMTKQVGIITNESSLKSHIDPF